ncbi:sphingomyelin synthase [Podila minutissima]|nr:sphingomyelin synthase [Podila minutissima]
MALTKERLKKWFFQRYKFTRQSILVTFLSIAIFALTLYFMNVMANVASYLSPNNTTTPKLSDRLFDAIPSITLLWLTDLADALLFAPTILLVLTHYRPLYLLCKVLLTWALCNLMRITTVAITSFPDPRNGCQHTVGEFFTTFLLHRCGDCMFSGHTVIFVISALVWTSHGYHRFPRRYRWLAWVCMLFVWALCIGSAFIIIANRAHYTVDVLVAFYVAGGNWYLLTYLLDRYIEDKGKLRDLTHPWGSGPDPRPHARERAARRQRQLEASDPEKNGALEDHVQMQPVDAVAPEKEEESECGAMTGYEPVVLESIAGEIQVGPGQSSRNIGRGLDLSSFQERHIPAISLSDKTV